MEEKADRQDAIASSLEGSQARLEEAEANINALTEEMETSAEQTQASDKMHMIRVLVACCFLCVFVVDISAFDEILQSRKQKDATPCCLRSFLSPYSYNIPAATRYPKKVQSMFKPPGLLFKQSTRRLTIICLIFSFGNPLDFYRIGPTGIPCSVRVVPTLPTPPFGVWGAVDEQEASAQAHAFRYGHTVVWMGAVNTHFLKKEQCLCCLGSREQLPGVYLRA